MRVLPTTALLMALLPIAAACGNPSEERQQPSVEVTVPSSDPGTQGGGSRRGGELLDLGASVETVGTRFEGGGELEITPQSVVYSDKADEVDAQNGLFAI